MATWLLEKDKAKGGNYFGERGEKEEQESLEVGSTKGGDGKADARFTYFHNDEFNGRI